MDLERALISRVITMRTGMRKAADARISVEFFEDESSRRAWQWCLDYWREYGESPTAKAFKADYPAYRLIDPDEPFDYIVEQMRERRRRILLVDLFAKVGELLNDDEPVGSPTRKVIEQVHAAMSRMEIEVSSAKDDNLGHTVDFRLERYHFMEDNKGRLLGIPTGYPSLDFASSGLQPEQLITFVGLSKAGKSIILMNMAAEAYSNGFTPLFISFEMSNREQETRFDGMISGTNYRKILNGQLTRDEWKNLAKEMRAWANFGDFILTSDSSGGMTLSAIEAKIQQHDPDIVFIDGVYMMDDEDTRNQKGSSAALTNITRGLKRMAQRHRIPIVGTTQALAWKVGSKKKGLTSEAIGYTSSFVQDSDLVILFYHEEDRPDMAKVRVSENRMGPRVDFTVHWDFDRMDFTEVDGNRVVNPVHGVDDGGF